MPSPRVHLGLSIAVLVQGHGIGLQAEASQGLVNGAGF